MAKAAADWFAGRDVIALFSSPMERAQETAQPLAAQFELPVMIDDRLMESANIFEGKKVISSLFRHPRYLARLWNPFEPSWGEPYKRIADRMGVAIAAARDGAYGHEVICVGHQLPIWVYRLRAERRHLWHNPARRECALASVTSLIFEKRDLTRVEYAEPVVLDTVSTYETE
jgi:broad specificity phosphatase PhoE